MIIPQGYEQRRAQFRRKLAEAMGKKEPLQGAYQEPVVGSWWQRDSGAIAQFVKREGNYCRMQTQKGSELIIFYSELNKWWTPITAPEK